MVNLADLEAGARWHPSGWSKVFVGGDTLSATDDHLAGFTTLQHSSRALTMGYRPAQWQEQQDDAFIVTGQMARGVKDGFFVWVVVEGDPAALPNFKPACLPIASSRHPRSVTIGGKTVVPKLGQ
jgi:hypothetical protein